MRVGGIASSFFNWLVYLKENSNHEIDVVVLNKLYHERFQNIEKEFNVYNLRSSKFLFYPYYTDKILVLKILHKLLVKLNLLNTIKYFFIRNYSWAKSYDVAISYSNDIPASNFLLMSNDFVEFSVKSRFKVAWIHNDIKRLGFTREYALLRYKNYDAIVNVSYSCKEQFDLLVPEYQNKSLVVENPVNLNEIKVKLNEPTSTKFNSTLMNFVTVARIENNQKRIDRIIDVADQLYKKNLKFHWYIVGDGPDLDKMIKRVSDKKLDNFISFLGFQSNPYPYIKNADYFVLASDYEAQPVTVIESLSIGTPVITTDIPVMYNLIQENVNGFIVKKEVSDFVNILSELIQSHKRLNFSNFEYNSFKRQFDNLLDFLENKKIEC